MTSQSTQPIKEPQIEGIDPSSLSPEEHAALAILESLPDQDLNRLKTVMHLGDANVIGSTTVSQFAQLCQQHGFDLSPDGVNAFKEANQLGNQGVVYGVIGKQTAQTYYTALMGKLDPTPAGESSSASEVAGIRQINIAGLHLIEEFEGLAQQLSDGQIAAYRDAVNIPTIGYGHTQGVYMGEVVTRDQAEAFLKEDLQEAEQSVSHLVSVALNDNQFAALVSFVFNLGAGALASSTLLRLLNGGDYQGAADQFLRWDRAGDRVLAGLTRRRQAERQLFLTPVG